MDSRARTESGIEEMNDVTNLGPGTLPDGSEILAVVWRSPDGERIGAGVKEQLDAQEWSAMLSALRVSNDQNAIRRQ